MINHMPMLRKKIEEGAIGKPVLVRCYGLDPD